MTLVNSRMVRGRCPCGAEHAACGPSSTSTPVDEYLEVAVVGGALKKYKVTMPGGKQTVLKLNEADARRYGVFEEPKAAAPKVEKETEVPDEPAEPVKTETPLAKKRAASNKSRTSANKSQSGGDA